jgi:hypothetical protein
MTDTRPAGHPQTIAEVEDFRTLAWIADVRSDDPTDATAETKPHDSEQEA